MYADRVEAETKRSVKERLNGNVVGDSFRRRQAAGKRQREDDDKWQHDLYESDEPQFSNRRIGTRDLRLKLQKKSIQHTSVKGPIPGGIRDLREKLSGTIYSQPMDTDVQKPKPKLVAEGSKSARKSVVVEAPAVDTKKVASTVSRKASMQKAESVDSFLQSLGLEKYSITFQAEEVDMATLIHMTDEDLKALSIPMGPRKKILLAVESKA